MSEHSCTEPTNNICKLQLATANRSGAIAILQLVGDVQSILEPLTNISDWPIGKLSYVKFDDIDDGIAVRLCEDVAQIMPHSGPRVVQLLTARLIELGAVLVDEEYPISAHQIYPEAQDEYEALALEAVARAQSPLAIDLLLDQPHRWRDFVAADSSLSDEDIARSKRLNRLITPPLIALVGLPNVGKSTLSNALLGRSMSITADMPGTTRDYTSGRINLAGLVVDWYDTPGLHQTTDPIEAKAIEFAHRLIQDADLIIALKDHEQDWPTLPRDPDLYVQNKIDLIPSILSPSPPGRGARVSIGDSPGQGEGPLLISAQNNTNIDQLVLAIRDKLIPPTDLQNPSPWLFDKRLIKPI
ncbi:MAG: 50S ribosome-binding GTPase [Planctomycetes bacterium]|nr:50S ribosome-binding GTPase [Planctomycetota bacterium]